MANPTSAKEWKSKKGVDLELPSGNTCLATRPGMEKILSSGVIPDELATIAMKQIAQADRGIPSDHQEKGPAELTHDQMAEILKTPSDIYRMMDAFDRIAVYCVVQPKLAWHKREKIDPETGHREVDDTGKITYEEIPERERDEDVLYTDDVDMDDKVFIFNWAVGGSADLQRFRQEYGDGLESLSASQVVADQAQLPTPD